MTASRPGAAELFVYRLLLYALPSRFRRAHGDEMLDAFADDLRAARARGAAQWALAFALECAEALGVGAYERAAWIVSDVRYAVRTLSRTPWVAAIVVATFAIAIGSSTAVFAVVDGVLLRPLPWAAADRLVFLYEREVSNGVPLCARCTPDAVDVAAWRRGRTLETVAAFARAARVLGGAKPVELAGLQVDENYFSLLGGPPRAGRYIRAADRAGGTPPVAVISEALWRDRFGASPSIAGMHARLDGVATVIIGVAPAGFRDPDMRAAPSFWLPLLRRPSAGVHVGASVVARLRLGVPVASAGTELDALARRAAPAGEGVSRAVAVVPVRDELLGDARRTLALGLAAVAVVVGIACANIAGLLVARSASRRREIVVRFALGAGRGRIVAQLFTETLALAAVGALAGVALAAPAVRALAAQRPALFPRIEDASLDPLVVAVTAGVTVLAALAAGLHPALVLASPAVGEALKADRRTGGGRAAERTREVFVVVEIALALAVTVLGTLLGRSVLAYARIDPGFDIGRLVFATDVQRTTLLVYANRGTPPGTARPFAANPPAYAREMRALRARIAALPGVESASLSTVPPLLGWTTMTFGVSGRGVSRANELIAFISAEPSYFSTLEIPLRQGRLYADSAGAREVVVNEAFQRRYFPKAGALGSRVTFGPPPDARAPAAVVGVVRDARTRSLTEPAAPTIYASFDPTPVHAMTVLIRTRLPAAALAPRIEAAWSALGPNRFPQTVAATGVLLAGQTAQVRMLALFLGALALAGVMLAATGLYGVMAYAVARRSREIGIRMALGASPRGMLLAVVRRAVTLAALGIAIGSVVGAVLARLVATFLYDVTPTDWPSYLLVAGLLTFFALCAAYVPALRATRVDPARALRYE